jgi:hypothetical protein
MMNTTKRQGGFPMLDAIEHRFSEMDDKLSIFKENSEVSRINAAAGEKYVEVSADTLEIITLAKQYSTVESTDDDGQFFSRAKAGVLDAILQAQGVDVQTVSGATYSSNGILEAVANALNIDFTNPNGTDTRGRRRH